MVRKMLPTMTMPNAADGLVKQLNMHQLEAPLVVIPVMIQGQGYTDHSRFLTFKYNVWVVFFISVKGHKVEPPHVHQNGHQMITQAVTIWPFTFPVNKSSLLIQWKIMVLDHVQISLFQIMEIGFFKLLRNGFFRISSNGAFNFEPGGMPATLRSN